MTVPRLNFACPAVLTGLACRSLGGAADPTAAELTQRRLEQLQAQHTELLKTISTLKANTGIAAAHELEANHNARQAELDQQIFEQQYPAPAPRRGMFKPKLTPEQQLVERQRAELAALAAGLRREADTVTQQSKQTAELLKQAEEQLAWTLSERQRLGNLFEEQLAVYILNLVAAGQAGRVPPILDRLRPLVRGSAMIALLSVLAALLNQGVEAALPELGDKKTVFNQHPDPLDKILAALIAIVRGRQLTRQELGTYPSDGFSNPAFLRLYQLVRVLAGWDYDEQSPDIGFLAPTLYAISQYQSAVGNARDHLHPAEEIADWAAESQDSVVQVICGQLLLELDRPDLIPRTCGIDWSAIQPPKRRGRWPELAGLFPTAPTGWPVALVDGWRAVLCCQVLLAAKAQAPPALYQQWLEESYNWPKSDFYWWVLATVKADPSLLREVRGDAAQFIRVAPV
ncbi:hypothetical protein JW859_10900 [bacterium]|nr:hypothetical protein [bacterium]